MTRNQKIALGCGGAGCLGLILLCVIGGLVYYFVYRSAVTRRDDWLANVNRNYNFNSNINSNDNANTNDNSDNSNSNSTSSSEDSTLSNDEKHRLFQAAAVTGDVEVIRRVNVKLGLMDEDFTPGDKYREFTAEHISWAGKNYEFVLSINTPEKARAYVNEHLP
ncbi:MAG TPA: hypothetical protein VFZ22_15985 [Pyrinomonadaceae bacterium]|nr:hypothetical protein [Pyrinomonadaceae bacterium]